MYTDKLMQILMYDANTIKILLKYEIKLNDCK